jgi:hypothetical protein
MESRICLVQCNDSHRGKRSNSNTKKGEQQLEFEAEFSEHLIPLLRPVRGLTTYKAVSTGDMRSAHNKAQTVLEKPDELSLHRLIFAKTLESELK